MEKWTRRSLLIAGGATAAATALATPSFARSRSSIDRAVPAKVAEMQEQLPFTQPLVSQAAGMLIIPRVTKGGLMFGAGYGEGSLLIGNAPVDYYSMAAATFGLQVGIQQYSTALFFMNADRLAKFRQKDGWTLGADLEYAVLKEGDAAGLDTNTYPESVFAVAFGHKGLLVAATLEGSKYSRIIR